MNSYKKIVLESKKNWNFNRCLRCAEFRVVWLRSMLKPSTAK